MNVKFQEVDIKTPFVQDIVQKLSIASNQSKNDIRLDIETELAADLDKMKDGPDSFYKEARKNAIESILFKKIKVISLEEEFSYEHFDYLYKSIIVKNKAFSNVRDRVTGKLINFNLIFTPPRKSWIKQADWIKKVTTAAATAAGDLIFNVDFAKQLISYAKLKNIKPKGGVYISNGGPVPDSYSYIEFLILHEIYHVIHADHFHESNKKGMTGTMQNYLGDFITNYKLLKAGYEQLPIGLFSSTYNYDEFSSMSEMQDRIIEDFKELNKEQKDNLNNQMDDHVNEDGDITNDEYDENEESQGSGDGESSDSQESNSDDGESSDSQESNSGDGESNSDDGESNSDDEESNSGNGEPDGGGSGKQSSGEISNDDSLDSSFTNIENDLPSAEEFSAKEIDNKIKENEETNQQSLEAIKKELENKKAAEGDKLKQKERDLKNKPETEPIQWKTLLKRMIPKPETSKTRSMTKMHRRTVAQMGIATGSRGIAVKAGESNTSEASLSLLFILDFSGSMSSTFEQINKSILKIINDNKSETIKEMFIITFASNFELFKINLDMNGKKHTYQRVLNKNEFAKKTFKMKLAKTDKNIKEIFKEDNIGYGTDFPEQLLDIMIKLKKLDFNQVIITDTDIASKDNIRTLRKACMQKGNPFSFNVLLDSQSSYTYVKKALGFKYKYMSYIK